MSILVQKYGGSSVSDATKIKSVALRIAESKKQGHQLAVVLSAMGDSTDQLIELAESISTNPEPRELDTLLSTGELVSCTLMAMALRELGIPAISMSGAQAGIKTDTAHGRASIVGLDANRIISILNSGTVAIVAGFQGVSEDMDITTLGRGGSDTTAVALAAAIGAERCEVFTDVDGIYTADPRVVPNAKKIKEIGYEEMLELASYGAKMHPRSIELGAWYKVPILVAASYESIPGTMIHSIDTKDNLMEIANKVSGVTYQKGIARITVRGIPDRPGIAASVFAPLSEANISVDTIVQNASAENLTDLSFTVDEKDLEIAFHVTSGIASSINATECTTSNQLGQVSIVGTGMQNAPGVASLMFSTLSEANVNIEMITTSQIRITCIVKETQIDDATRVLHHAFDLDS
ncbi:MAG: aspartate kinase [Chloroflexi bacterium]|nr:aspartate kinase [Chloroflexota bacterium]|tara:strand:+ start:39150 stop:40373 length:1224 start_codon:yes stop_codon:yes gene_type:complete